jgi:hypothetical protein
MRYAKRILVAAAIFSSYSAALAFDTDSGAPAAKPNTPTASGSGYAAKARERLHRLSSGSSTLSSNKDITISSNKDTTITIPYGNITFHGSTPLKIKILWRRNPCE